MDQGRREPVEFVWANKLVVQVALEGIQGFSQSGAALYGKKKKINK